MNEGNAGYRGVDTQLVGLERMRVMQVIEEQNTQLVGLERMRVIHVIEEWILSWYG